MEVRVEPDSLAHQVGEGEGEGSVNLRPHPILLPEGEGARMQNSER
jgi:hypothetical protein